jgi:Transglycosylase SLT domain
MESASLPAAGPPKLLLGLPLALLAGLVAALLGLALLLGGSPGCGGDEAVGGLGGEVPARLVPLYRAAAGRYGLGQRGPSVLAAINEVETGFGRDLGTSSAGAIGWMQFEPSSWAAYGVDANGDGRKDPYSPADAIFAAARLLRAAGAPGDWRSAIFSYNHAGWYVAKVLAEARRFAAPDGSTQLAGFTGCAAAALTPNEAIARMLAEAARLSALRPTSEYVWGGSHGASPTPPNGPFDCSSAVSHLLQVAGFHNRTMDTAALARWGEPGPGRWVTIFVKPHGPQAHTFIGFSAGLTPPVERYWGTSGIVAPGKGPGWIGEDKLSNSYLAGFEMRHPPEL